MKIPTDKWPAGLARRESGKKERMGRMVQKKGEKARCVMHEEA